MPYMLSIEEGIFTSLNRMASGDWQVNRSLVECNRHMLQNQIATDVTFNVGTSKETTKTVHAHKYALVSRSPVFFAMFCGDLPPDKGEDGIRITDIEPEAFESMLRYIYCEEAILSPDIVLPTLYAAKKYMVTALVENCIQFLEDNLHPDNVCLIYEQSILYDETALVEKCINFIETRTEDVVRSPSFPDISLVTLKRILNFDKLSISELEIFNGCLKWAEEECKRQNQEMIPENKRLVLQDALYLIRFPTMLLRDFANTVSQARILSAEEKCSVFEYMTCDHAADTEATLRFSTKHRLKPQPSVLRRFTAFGKSNVYSGDCSIMKVQCDKPILVKGFGVTSSTQYDALAEVHVTIKQDRCILCNKSISISDNRSGEIIQVHLAESVVLQSGVWHTVIITFHFYGDHDQGSCRRGKAGYRSITCDGVAFDFDRADSAGFVPEILFCRV